jgi:acylphosphatase
VQGVGFRWFVERQARALKVTGYVRNLDTGHVEVFAEGQPAALEKLREKLERGPLGARVTAVEEQEALAAGYSDFVISY